MTLFWRGREKHKLAPTVHVDWSLYGGSEQTNPPDKYTPNKNVTGGQWMPDISTVPGSADDYLWALNEEPHRTRRMAIMHAHPEVKKLMGHEPLTKYVVMTVVCVQLAIALLMYTYQIHPLDWRFLLTAYVIGGTANQHIFLAIHEITHNLAFKSIRANRILAIIANLPIGIPYAMLFKPYHIEHHKHLGEDGIDTDIPTRLEVYCLNNVLGKAFFATFQLAFYALRPGFIRAQKLSNWHVLNLSVQLVFDAALFELCQRSWTPLLYLLESSFFAGSLHPMAGHFIAEHYVFSQIEQETWSYYGPLNILLYNVGYHNEHHDFPSIPWTRLPALHRIASEFYTVLPYHTSWTMTILQFIFTSESGMNMRIKRKNKHADPSDEVPIEDAPNNTGWELLNQPLVARTT
ncbi:hypothetical protein MPSI1_002676 [Malassezia psittaci]|uniref:sphingolipid 4-desaturase n=1 Tax=Malassezia psittaci TaxID=1821823 RepID=A0AAF0JLB3_9BASI|nr:hypothetical protein MPSI1_002676 [Malassezia psittaci]